MITEPEARHAAEQTLAAYSLDVAITGSEEHDVGWIYFYQSERFLETGDFRDALVGNAPLLVDRHDGSVHPTGTARPVAEYVDR